MAARLLRAGLGSAIDPGPRCFRPDGPFGAAPACICPCPGQSPSKPRQYGTEKLALAIGLDDGHPPAPGLVLARGERAQRRSSKGGSRAGGGKHAEGNQSAAQCRRAHALRAMGHGDDLIIADTNFPSDSMARQTRARQAAAGSTMRRRPKPPRRCCRSIRSTPSSTTPRRAWRSSASPTRSRRCSRKCRRRSTRPKASPGR